MDGGEFSLVYGVADGGEIEGLTAHHILGGLSQNPHHPQAGFRRGRALGFRKGSEGGGLQHITGQDGRGFVEGPVEGGSASAQVVIVHCRQVVMDQGVAVEQLHRCCRGVGVIKAAAEGEGGGVTQHRPQALAATEGGVADGFIQPACQLRLGSGLCQPIRCLNLGGGLSRTGGCLRFGGGLNRPARWLRLGDGLGRSACCLRLGGGLNRSARWLRLGGGLGRSGGCLRLGGGLDVALHPLSALGQEALKFRRRRLEGWIGPGFSHLLRGGLRLRSRRFRPAAPAPSARPASAPSDIGG